MQGDIEGVARLLGTRRVDVDAFDASGKAALMYAARHPETDTRIVELLIQHVGRFIATASSLAGLRALGDAGGMNALGVEVRRAF